MEGKKKKCNPLNCVGLFATPWQPSHFSWDPNPGIKPGSTGIAGDEFFTTAPPDMILPVTQNWKITRSFKCQVLKISASFWCGHTRVERIAWAFHAPPLSAPPPGATALHTVSLTGSFQPTSCSAVFPGAPHYAYITSAPLRSRQ